MNTNFFRNTIRQITAIDNNAWQDLECILSNHHLKSKEYIIQVGEKGKYAYFLEDGIIRVFLNKDGSDYNKAFFIKGSFPTPLTSLLTNSASNFSIQALTPCKLLRFSFSGFKNLFSTHRCLEQLYSKILEIEWIKKEFHDIRMVTNNATDNYLTFRKEFPGIELKIPQYHIASYLGITPIQLSRLRKKLDTFK